MDIDFFTDEFLSCYLAFNEWGVNDSDYAHLNVHIDKVGSLGDKNYTTRVGWYFQKAVAPFPNTQRVDKTTDITLLDFLVFIHRTKGNVKEEN